MISFHPAERRAVLLLITLVVVLAGATILLDSLGKAPFTEPYTNESKEGDLVSLEGVIGEVRTTASGGHLILIVSGATVFVPASSVGGGEFSVGDSVSLIGTVETYRGEKEIVIESADDICTGSES